MLYGSKYLAVDKKPKQRIYFEDENAQLDTYSDYMEYKK